MTALIGLLEMTLHVTVPMVGMVSTVICARQTSPVMRSCPKD